MNAKRPIDKREATHDGHEVKRTTCCIVGGGPAGGVLALLLARRGVNVTLPREESDPEGAMGRVGGDTLRSCDTIDRTMLPIAGAKRRTWANWPELDCRCP